MAESKISRVYNVLAEHPTYTSAEVSAHMGDISAEVVRQYRSRLYKQGVIDFDDDHSVIILKPFKAIDKGIKQQVYEEMIDTYMDDFRAQNTFADRLAVGREIRLILDKM